MTTAAFVDRLHGVRRTGHDKGVAICPAHEDRRPSLSWRLTGEGAVLLHCHAGCEVADIVAALGLSLSDLFPPRQEHIHAVRPRVSALTPLVATFERDLLVVHVLLSDIAAGKFIHDDDRACASTAAGRIWDALQEARLVL